MVEACLNVGSEEGRLVGDCDVSSASPVPWAEAVATGRSAKFVAPEMAGANARHVRAFTRAVVHFICCTA
jgi:hypothetical protein